MGLSFRFEVRILGFYFVCRFVHVLVGIFYRVFRFRVVDSFCP